MSAGRVRRAPAAPSHHRGGAFTVQRRTRRQNGRDDVTHVILANGVDFLTAPRGQVLRRREAYWIADLLNDGVVPARKRGAGR